MGELVEGADVSRLGSLARRGAAWTFALVVTRRIVGIGVTAVLARILSPGDYGLVGMVATLTAFLQVFSDMGLSWATVQRKHLTRGQVDNLFWVNALFGALLWGACVLAGPGLAWFYGRQELARVAQIMGATFLAAGIAVQPMALLRRQMRFKRLSLAELGSFLVAAATGLALAIAGFGYWALVGQALAGQAARMVLLFAVSGYRPGRPRVGQGTMALLKFGGWLAAAGISIYFARNMDRILIGEVCGVEALGHYSRAYFLMMLPAQLACGAVTGVMIPALSRLQGDPARIGSAYRKAITAIAIIGTPIAFGLLLTAPETVMLVYGRKWMPVIPILRWLAVAAVFYPIYTTVGWLFITSGRVRLYFGLCTLVAPVMVVAFTIGIKWGVKGVAAANAMMLVFVTMFPSMYLAHRVVGLRFWKTLRCWVPPLLAGGLMALMVYGTEVLLRRLNVEWSSLLLAKIVVGAISYLVMLRVIYGRLFPVNAVFLSRTRH